MPNALQLPVAKSYHCRHIHASGVRCGSPALRGEEFCYFHHTARRRAPDPHPRSRALIISDPCDNILDLEHLPEDRASIQICVYEVIRRLAANQIDARRAGLMIYAFQTIASTLPRLSRRARASSPQEEEDEPVAVKELTLDPDLGPLAPIAEFVTDDEAHKSLMQKFVEYCERPPNACRRCADRAIVDANKAEGRRLMAELNRRRSLGLPEYDPPLDPNTPYPNDALCAAETARIAAEWATPSQTAPSSEVGTIKNAAILSEAQRAESKDPETANTTPIAHTVLPTTAHTSFAEANDPPPHAEAPHEPALPNPDPDTWAKFAAHLPNPNNPRRPS